MKMTPKQIREKERKEAHEFLSSTSYIWDNPKDQSLVPLLQVDNVSGRDFFYYDDETLLEDILS